MQLTADRSADAVRRARPIYRVFVSSTWLDLQPERTALMNALHRMEEMRFVGMEFFGNRPDDTHAASLDQVEACEVFVGVIGFRYGSGITEAEYRRARELGIPCFIYFKDRVAFHPELTDGDPALEAKLTAFQAELMREHTVKTFPNPAELAANATADLHNWVAARWVAVTAEPPPSLPARPRPAAPDADRVNLLRLVDRIHHDWVLGVLEASLHHRAWLELGLDWRDDAVEHPWDRIVVALNRPIQTLATDDSIARVFSAAQNTLLVLGEPGAGKTTTLLELARDAIERVRRSPHEPAPVVLALSTWTGRHRDLFAWLVEELTARYQVPKRLAQTWLTEGRLLLLLDGLDEVAEALRERCVAQINAFAEAHCPPGLAVTCRVAEYAALTTRLQLRAAICLQPLTPAQVDRYFAAAGPRLQPLHAALQRDAGLRELARTPLMLSVMTVAWHDAPPDEVADLASGSAATQPLREKLFAAYVRGAWQRRGKSSVGHTLEQSIAWLAWLAQRMRENGQTLFAFEQLQPVWLASRGAQLGYFVSTRLLALVALALPFLLLRFPAFARLEVLAAAGVVGLIFGTVDFGFAQRIRGERRATLRFWVLVLIVIGLAIGWGALHKVVHFPYTPLVALYLGAVGLAFGVPADVRTLDVKPAHSIRWSPRVALDRTLDALAGLNLVLLVLLVAAFFVSWFQQGWAATRRDVVDPRFLGVLGSAVLAALGIWFWLRPARTWRNILRAFGLVLTSAAVGTVATRSPMDALGMFAVMAAPAVALGVFRGFEPTMIDPTRPRASGAWFWLRAPLAAAMVVGLAATVGVLAWSFNTVSPVTRAPGETGRFAAEIAVVGATIAFLRFGGFNGVQHVVLRKLLVRAGHFPPDAETFFHHAVQGALMQKVGAGYRFVHALLLDYLANLAPARRR